MDYLFPSIAGISSAFAGCAYLYSKIRPIVPTSVNCWFCNADFKTLYKNKNHFLCPSCHQYNGFTEEGDYNCDIPAQHTEGMNLTLGSYTKQSMQQSNSVPNNGLCETCNLNQALKIRAISDFMPVNEVEYELELKEYRQRLERIYGLCRQCEATVHQTLGKQNTWLKPKLISWRLEQSRRQIMKGVAIISTKPIFVKFLHFLLLFLSLCLCFSFCERLEWINTKEYLNDLYPSTAHFYKKIDEFLIQILYIATSLILIIVLSSGKEHLLKKDVFCCLLWVLLLVLSSSKNFIDVIILQQLQFFVSCCAFVTSLWVAFAARRFVAKKSETLQRVKETSLNDSLDFSRSTFNCSLGDSDPFFPIDSLSDSILQQTVPNDRRSSAQPSLLPNPPTHIKNLNNKFDLGTTLDSLKIGTPQKRDLQEDFNPKALFTGTDSAPQKNILTPSKLGVQMVTQSSWVAGGYWGTPSSPQRGRLTRQNVSHHLGEEKRDSPLFSLSRSSSQSSGFVSQFSGRGSSSELKNPFSAPPEHERASSITSEPVFPSWGGFAPSDRTASLQSLKPQSVASYDARSECSMSPSYCLNHSQRSPTPNSTVTFRSFAPNPVTQDEVKESGTSTGTSWYCNQWMAFVFGLSVSANAFLFIILYKIGI